MTSEDIDAVANDLGGFVSQYTRCDLPQEMQLKILEELDRYLLMSYPSETLRQQESAYLGFGNRFKTLKLKLWQVIANQPLSEEQREQLAEQKQWIYDFIDQKYSMTSPLDRASEMYCVDRVFSNVLNGFSQQPMNEETFREYQEKIRTQDNLNGAAVMASCWSTKITHYEADRKHHDQEDWEFPFGIVTGWSGGSDSVYFYFKSDKPPIIDNFELSDLSAEKLEYRKHAYDIHTKRELQAPDDCTSIEQLLAWIDREDRGDIYFDKESQSIVCCQDAKMAVLDVDNWIESDRISTEELRTKIHNNPIESFCISGYRNLDEEGLASGSVKPVIPLIAIETKEGMIAVLRAKNLRFRSNTQDYVNLVFRHRLAGWRKDWFSTYLTGEFNETIGNRHCSASVSQH